ncbi:MAG: hypothetical protein CL944_01140 [Candidatus Diapherotrites archaeon]|uniref:Uncharacterized protein n=1 Tax=Candidatus Iainarchaeum sp. TaxID=3101447 RepID=A0A2D6LPF6_9ARCH|nr:hypothetical protein [Candidatus Diapherotrites archaeon]|tara:strand:- start:14431 stop:15150 length:720 start_codon:yes stop_codon:yes gene_type:complete
MVKIQDKDEKFILSFSDEETKNLKLKNNRDYELTKAKDGLWVLIEGNENSVINDTEQKIIELLKKLSLSERVEGNFEKNLNPEGLARFNQLLKDGKIEKFKLNESYKKAVYRLPEQGEKKYDNKEKEIQEYALENDGFLVVKNEQRAKALSNELQGQIKDGKIKGTRAFTGEFYIIENDLLVSTEKQALKELRVHKTSDLDTLSKNTKLTNTLLRIGLEFLKEDGQVIEKKKNHYQYIE